MALTIAVGLAVHRSHGVFSSAVKDILGDALWAAMVTWGLAVIAPALPLAQRALAALTISFAVEFSQLLHVPALDAIRRTTVGQLVLGSGFNPRDLVAYVAGVLAVVALDRWASAAGRRMTT